MLTNRTVTRWLNKKMGYKALDAPNTGGAKAPLFLFTLSR